MSVVGELSVIITADAEGVKKAVTASNAALKKGGAQLRKSANEWGKWAAAASVAAAGVATAILKSNLSSIREIKNLAEAANTSIDVFQQQAFATEQMGISTEKYGDILKDVNDRIGDFITSGAGPMVDFFEQIGPKVGVTIDQFKRLSGAEALQLYVSSIEKANVSQAEMIFFMEAIAGDSARLLPLLQNNGKAMREQANAARELGIGLSTVDVARVEEANDALAKAAAVTEAQMQKATVALAPFITAIVEKFAEASGSMDSLEESVISGMRGMARGVSTFADGLHGIKIMFQGIEVVARGFNAAIAHAFTGLMMLVSDVGNAFLDLINIVQQGALAVAQALRLPVEHIKALEGSINAINSFKADPGAFIEFANAQTDALIAAKETLNNSLTEKLPSQKVNEFFDEVQAKAIEAGKVLRQELKLDKLSTTALDGYFDAFKSQSIITANLFKDNINGIELNTSALDAFFAVAHDGAAKTQLEIRDALSSGGMDTSEIDRVFAFINAKAKESGSTLNEAMKGSLDTNSIQVFFDMLNQKKGEFGNVMDDMFSGENLNPEQIQQFMEQITESSIINGEQIRQNLIGQGISPEEAEEFLAAYLAKTDEYAEQISSNLNGGKTAEGGESEDVGENTGVKGFASQELIDAMATEAQWLLEQHELEIEMLEQANARGLNIGESYEQAKTDMERRHSNERRQIAAKELQEKVAGAMAMANGLLALGEAFGDKSQKQQKRFRRMQVIADTAAGVMKAFATASNIYEAIGLSAMVIAKGKQSLDAINSSSSGGGSMPSVGSAPTAQAAPQQQSSQAQSSRNISINMTGSSMFSADAVRELIGQINDQVGDGVSLATSGG